MALTAAYPALTFVNLAVTVIIIIKISKVSNALNVLMAIHWKMENVFLNALEVNIS